MGEIATWSAVKSKVGLGKDGNDCPTKAELLALSPTGTGEKYVGLEISNASSYGNNETVQLSDIHKVTYKYSFAAVNTNLNFPALGGKPTPEFIRIGSTRQKYLDGVASGSPENISYNTSSTVPDWLNENNGTWTATENTSLSQRSTNVTFTQGLSGKTITVSMVQAAGVETWEYNLSVEKSSLSFSALGGVSTTGDGYINIFSNKQRYINGKVSGSPVTVSYSSNDFPDWLSYQTEPNNSVKAVATENKSESNRSFIRTVTQAESGKKVTITYNQAAGVKTYGTLTVYSGSVSDIPASGGSRSSFSSMPSYSQTWGWNGSTTGGGTITSGASISYGTAVSAGSLGITVKPRTQVGALTGTLSLNGKTKSVSVPVYQAANEITGYTYGPWSVKLAASSYTIGNTGGSVTLYPMANRIRYANYTSGSSTNEGSDTAIPSLSTNGTSGFSLSGTTLSASANTSTSSRSIRVTASYGGDSDYVDITQGGASVSYKYYFNWGSAPGSQTSKSITHPALGKTEEVPFISYKKKVINGTETHDIYLVGASRNVPSWTTVNIVDNGLSVKTYENTAESSRSATVTVTQLESGKEITLNINQSAATITYDYVFSIS